VAKRIGLVGCGRWGLNHYQTLQRLREEGLVSFLAVCDIKPEATANLNADAVYHDAALMMAKERLDAVALVTPPATHLELLKEALAVGLPVLLEKPLSDRHEESAIALANLPSDAVVVVGYLLRHHPGLQRVKSLLEENVLGALQGIRYVRRTQRAKPPGATPLTTLAVHGLDLISWLLDKPLNSLQTVLFEVDDRSARIAFDAPTEGQSASIDVAWQSDEEIRSVVVEGKDRQATLDFGANTLSISALQKDLQASLVERFHGEPLLEEWRFFLRRIDAGEGSVYPPAVSLDDLGCWLGRHDGR
jgi:predicted dehydrogenase